MNTCNKNKVLILATIPHISTEPTKSHEHNVWFQLCKFFGIQNQETLHCNMKAWIYQMPSLSATIFSRSFSVGWILLGRKMLPGLARFKSKSENASSMYWPAFLGCWNYLHFFMYLYLYIPWKGRQLLILTAVKHVHCRAGMERKRQSKFGVPKYVRVNKGTGVSEKRQSRYDQTRWRIVKVEKRLLVNPST
jgi:hypothetical protein